MESALNFDRFANTPFSERYIEIFTEVHKCGNSNSSHIIGKKAKDLLYNAKKIILELFPYYKTVEFIPGGGTCANKRVFHDCIPIRARVNEKDIIVISGIEHSSISRYVLMDLHDRGYTIIIVPAHDTTIVNLDEMNKVFTEFASRIALVSCMMVNNETGVIQPINEIKKLIKQHNLSSIFHSDTCHGFDKLHQEEWRPDIVTFSLYKYGCGHIGLVLSNVRMKETSYGTYDVATIYASAVVFSEYNKNIIDHEKSNQNLKDKILEMIKSKIDEKDYILISQEYQVSNAIAIIFPWIKGSYIQSELSKMGICVGSGSACTHNKPSHTLLNSGYCEKSSEGLIRITFDSSEISFEMGEQFVNAVYEVIQSAKKLKLPSTTCTTRNLKYEIKKSSLREEPKSITPVDIVKVNMNAIMISYAELQLKGQNRSHFIKILLKQIKKILTNRIQGPIIEIGGACIINCDATMETIKLLQHIPGISVIRPIYSTRDESIMNKLIVYSTSVFADILNQREIKSFSVRVNLGVMKKYCGSSYKDIEYQLGKQIKEQFKVPVNLTNPDVELNISVNKGINCWYQKYQGVAGLPLGSESRYAIMITKNNIERSQFAIKSMSKRGATPIIIFDDSVTDENKIIIRNDVVNVNYVEMDISVTNFEELSSLPCKHLIIETNDDNLPFVLSIYKAIGKMIDKNVFGTSIYELNDRSIDPIFDSIGNKINISRPNEQFRTLSLISGGIDSPVASYKMLQMGSKQDYIHFAFVDTDQQNIIDTIKKIYFNPIHTKLYYVDISELQKRIVKECQESYRTMLYKTFMVKIANTMKGYHSIVTGNSWGQVASQTPENIYITDCVSKMPISSPVLILNKDEIIEIANRIGTYEKSICNGNDCCVMFTPAHPILKADLTYIHKIIERFSDFMNYVKINEIDIY